jgi:hypothetical protein
MIGSEKLQGKNMENTTEEYKGCSITVTPIQDNGGLWDFAYRITQPGKGEAITRSKTAGGYNTAAIACAAGLQVAHTEVDNLQALAGNTN